MAGAIQWEPHMADKVQVTPSIIRRKKVEARTGLSRSSIYAAIKAGTFPTPISLGEKAVGWLDHEIDDWIAARVTASRSEGV
jgi:prophage regulatory protein